MPLVFISCYGFCVLRSQPSFSYNFLKSKTGNPAAFFHFLHAHGDLISVHHIVSAATRHTSHLTRHTSHVTPHMSHVTPHALQVGVKPWTCARERDCGNFLERNIGDV
jgi:hypothetical protein